MSDWTYWRTKAGWVVDHCFYEGEPMSLCGSASVDGTVPEGEAQWNQPCRPCETEQHRRSVLVPIERAAKDGGRP